MNRIIRLFFFALPLLCITGQSIATTQVVNIENFQFSPVSLTINLGESVKWTNLDSTTHTVTSDTGVWDSQNIAPGASFSRTFNKDGSYAYHCKIHPSMTGTIVVRTADQSRVQIGKDIISSVLPLQLNLTDKKSDMVYLGSYIVNAQSACADCHSCPTYAPDHNPFLMQPKQFNNTSYLAGGVAFGPTIVSANLTPDSTGKPAGLTLTDFKKLLRNGQHNMDGMSMVMQVMPWPAFGMMGDYDLNAVYQYLSAIPAAATPTTLCDGPGQ